MITNKLVAHRGDNTNYPENSYTGLEAALKAGALFIEFDLQMNLDGSLIVFHDINFKRVGDDNSSIFEVSNEQLKHLSIHQPDRFEGKYNPTQAPYLEDILELLKQYPQAHAFIEVKRESLAYWGLSKVMDKVLAALSDFESQVTIISFSLSAINYTQQHSQFRTGLVLHAYDEGNYDIANILQPDYLICAYDIFPEKETPWKGDWQWMVYSINDVAMMQQVLKREEISLIETDDIGLMLGVEY